MIEYKQIALGYIERNEGQLPGVPRNPRQWTKKEVINLATSMSETPELVEARGLIVMPYQKVFVVLGGNMRLEAAKSLKWEKFTGRKADEML